MGAVKKSDIPEIAAFMPDFWEFIKAVWIAEESDEYWDYVHLKADELYKKYPSEFAKSMILAFCDYQDNKWKKERGERYGNQGKRNYPAPQ